MRRRRVALALLLLLGAAPVHAATYVQHYALCYLYPTGRFSRCDAFHDGTAWLLNVGATACANDQTRYCAEGDATVTSGVTTSFFLSCIPAAPQPAETPTNSNQISFVVPPQGASPTRTATPTPSATPTLTPTAITTSTAPGTPVLIGISPSGSPAPSATSSATVNLARQGQPIARVAVPTGSGSKTLATIVDGVKPPPTATDPTLQYDTYDGANTATDDWFGVTWATPQTIHRVVFQAGLRFWDGGWFASAPSIWASVGGTWHLVATAAAPAFSATAPAWTVTTYTLATPVQADGVMIRGVPGGQHQFISCAELEVY